jgi:hypothetical protein
MPVKIASSQTQKKIYNAFFSVKNFKFNLCDHEKNGNSINRYPHLKTDSQTKSHQIEIAQSGNN